MSSWVYDFDEALPAGTGEAKLLLGGKGASLQEMMLAGLSVPPGFTITTECCERYFELGRRWPDGLEEQVRAHLAALEKRTGRRFGEGVRPLLVSVRSGAARSMPGMMDTLLNCGLHPGMADILGDTPHFWALYLQFVHMFAKTVHGVDEAAFAAEDGQHATPCRAKAEEHLAIYRQLTGETFPTEPWEILVQCINAVFESWHSERAVAYRQRNDIRGLAGTAVNVQAMFPSEVSGIVFTQDPNDLSAEQLVIEAAYGLGEAVVSGDVTPDRFIVKRSNFADCSAHIGHKASRVVALGQEQAHDPAAASLNREQLTELCELSMRIERHFGHPVDIEWGWADGHFSLLQARPIRGLDIARDIEAGRQQEILRLKALAQGRRLLWVTHNLAETLRFPTPLTWDIVRQFMSGDGGFGRMYQQLGYRPGEIARREGFLELICGRIYADPQRLAGLFWDAMPLTYDLDEMLADKSLLDRAPQKFDPARADNRFLAKLPGNLLGMWRASRNMKRARRDAKRRFEQDILPSYLVYVREKRAQDLTALSDDELLAELQDRRAKVLDEFGPESLKPGFFGGLAFDAVAGLLVQLMGEQEGNALASTLTGGLEGDTTFEQDALLYRIAQNEATLSDFLERFGHRCTGEMELSQHRWRENPAYLEQIITRCRSGAAHNPIEIHHRNEEKRRAAEAMLPQRLAEFGGSVFREQLDQDLADARALLPYRESGKHYLMMGYELIRLAIEELARRWDLGAGIYHLKLEELPQFPRQKDRLLAAIAQRRTRWQALQRLDMPDVIDSRELESLGLARKIEASSHLHGLAIASGVATGTARIVFDPQDAGDLGQDYVLVCPSTDPGWTPLFLNARGLIVERGGVVSHRGIVARAFCIPAVVFPV